MGEHRPDTAGVGGSSPPGPTTSKPPVPRWLFSCGVCVLRSEKRGSGGLVPVVWSFPCGIGLDGVPWRGWPGSVRSGGKSFPAPANSPHGSLLGDSLTNSPACANPAGFQRVRERFSSQLAGKAPRWSVRTVHLGWTIPQPVCRLSSATQSLLHFSGVHLGVLPAVVVHGARTLRPSSQ